MYNSLFLYDWQKIYEKSRGDASSIFVIFKMIVNNEVPRNKFDKTYKFSNLRFIGGSFLVHPDVLLYNSYKYSHVEVAQYLALASLRPLSDYLTTGKTSLERNLLELDISFFEDNRLLNIQEDKIIFEYEEVPQEKTQWH
tara:strand:+ start:626 stop:1045 length:420 start_codon:yes stop_codon:yes gene_type:complete